MAEDTTNNEHTDDEVDGIDDQDSQGEGSTDSHSPALKADGTPFTTEDLARLNASLKAARREARAAKKGKIDDTSTDAPDLAKAVADASAARDGHWKPVLVRTAARSAFLGAGLVLPAENSEAALSRVVKLLDTDDLDISDDGEIDGLTEQVEEIKRDFPELFTTTTHRRNGRVDGADKGGHSNGRVKTASERQAAQLLGGR